MPSSVTPPPRIPDYSIQRAITEPHRFQIGMAWAPPGCGPAWHTHDYTESFFILSGPWTFYWGNEDRPGQGRRRICAERMGYDFAAAGDVPQLRVLGRFHRLVSTPCWSRIRSSRARIPIGRPRLKPTRRANGYAADERGKMVHPSDYEAQKARQNDYLLKTFRDQTGVDLQDYRPPR